jgi:catechol 2,3-dioxygenase-like lactoylglutathione lyase family enzyme
VSPIAGIDSTAIFPVVDMGEEVAFYRRLGFKVEAFDAGYAWVSHDGHEILHLRRAFDLDPALNESAAYLRVTSADEWHGTWGRETTALSDLEDKPWGMREFSFTDPSGNLIRVGHNL